MHTDCTPARRDGFGRMKMGVIFACGATITYGLIALAVFL